MRLIIIPTFNESLNIEKIINELVTKVTGIEILVVDDTSTDGTIETVERFKTKYAQVHLLVRPNKTGLGDAYRAGFRWAIDRQFESIVQMDADGSHRVDDLLRMLDVANSNDVVIGSRWVQGGRIQNWPLSRYLLSRLGNLYGRVLLRIPIKDATAGFRIYSSEAIEKAGLLDSTSQGYVFQLENSVRVTEANLSVREVPITFIEREQGESKMSQRIVKEAIVKVTVWGLQGRLFKRKLFVR